MAPNEITGADLLGDPSFLWFRLEVVVWPECDERPRRVLAESGLNKSVVGVEGIGGIEAEQDVVWRLVDGLVTHPPDPNCV